MLIFVSVGRRARASAALDIQGTAQLAAARSTVVIEHTPVATRDKARPRADPRAHASPPELRSRSAARARLEQLPAEEIAKDG